MRGVCFSRRAGGRNLGPDSTGGAKRRIHSSLERRAQTGPAGFTGLDLQMVRGEERRGVECLHVDSVSVNICQGCLRRAGLGLMVLLIFPALSCRILFLQG